MQGHESLLPVLPGGYSWLWGGQGRSGALGLPGITLTKAVRPAMVEVVLWPKRPRHNPGLTPREVSSSQAV